MALDVLALGPFLFTDFAVPELLPGGGKHHFNIKKLPGGDRVIDGMGPDDDDRQFRVIHVGSGAQDEVLTLDQMRISGQPWPYSNGMEARIVVIASFNWHVEKFNVIHSDICLTPVDNPAGSSAASSSPDDLIGSDLGNASAIANDNIATQSSLTPAGTGGIGRN